MTRHIPMTLLLTAALSAPVPFTLATERAPMVAKSAEAGYAEFALLADDYFRANLALNPLDAASYGVHDYDDQFGDYLSDDYLQRQRALEQHALDRARTINRLALDPAQRLQLDSFLYSRKMALKAFDFPFWYFPATQEVNPAVTLASQAAGDMQQPFTTVADYDAFLRKLDGFGRWSAQAIHRMQQGVTKGYALPRPVVIATATQMRSYVSARVEDSVFWTPIRQLPVSFSAADRQRLTRAYRQAIRKVVNPAFRSYANYLDSSYPARKTLGWRELPHGKEWYDYLVAQQTTVDVSPDALFRHGEQEVARILREMEDIRRQVGFKGSLKAFWKSLLNDPKYKFRQPADIFADQVRLKKLVEAQIPNFFSRTPRTSLQMKPIPKAREETDGGLWYQAGSADGRTPGIYWVNTRPDMALYTWETEANFLHEAIPGHHFQISLKQEQRDVPAFMRYSNFNGFEEGWALYVESLGPEMGLTRTPLQAFGRLNNEMLRALRLVVEPGLHTRGWTIQQARQYMLDRSALTPDYVDYEVVRYLANPGQALSYNVGKQTIRQLRQEAEQQLGSRFDLRAFHGQVIDTGTLPLSVLQQKIRHWVATQDSAQIGNR